MRQFFGDYMYRLYLSVLKLVLSIIPTIAVILGFINQFFHQSGVNTIQFISVLTFVIIRIWINVVISCTVCVTIVFLLLKFCQIEIGEERVETFENIFKQSKNSISRGETIIEIIGMLFLLWLLCFRPQYISTYSLKGGNLTPLTPLFNSSMLSFYHPIILAVYGIGILLAIGKLILGKWSIGLSIVHLIYKVGACLLFCLLITNQSLFNPAFFNQLFIGRSFEVMDYWEPFSKVMMIGMVMVTCFDVINPFSKIIKSI